MTHLTCALAVLAALVAHPAAAEAISAAETLLFQTNHLQNVRAPAHLCLPQGGQRGAGV
jgi:hypothetical protein